MGARLLDVAGMDFEKAERPEVDVKNFKSALFVIHLGEVTPGAEAKVSLTSDFFISSTQFYVFNETRPEPWIISDAANLSLPDRVQELVVTVTDGGPLDSDGKADGRITLVAAPGIRSGVMPWEPCSSGFSEFLSCCPFSCSG